MGWAAGLLGAEGPVVHLDDNQVHLMAERAETGYQAILFGLAVVVFLQAAGFVLAWRAGRG